MSEEVTVEKEDNKVKVKNSSIGLDVGTGFLVSSCSINNNVEFKNIRSAFFKISREFWDKSLFNVRKVKYVKVNEDIYIVGKDAINLSAMTNSDLRRPLASGVINRKEKSASPVLREMFSYLLRDFIKTDNDIVVFSVPGEIPGKEADIDFHSMSLSSLCESMNIRAEPLNEAYAVAISELGDDSETALSFSLGAGRVNVCLTYKGIMLFNFSTNKSGDWIDATAQASIDESLSMVSIVKERDLDLSKPVEKQDYICKALLFAYKSMIKRSLNDVISVFKKKENVRIYEEIPIVISGGTSMPKGFIDLFKTVPEFKQLPFKVSDVIHADQPLNSVANGCRKYAESF